MLAEAVPFYKDLFSKCVTTPSALSRIGSFIKHDEGPFSALAKPFDEEGCLENSQAMHVGKSPGPDGLPIEFWNKVWSRVASAFILICNETHLCCHSRGSKDKCGSSPRRTSREPLVMRAPSRS